jgi:cytochrome P450
MEPTIRATVHELLDAVDPGAPFDLVASLTFPLPATIVFTLIGVPPEDYAQLKRWCGYRAGLTFGRARPDEQVEHAQNIVAYRGYLRALVDERVARRTGDLTSALIDIHDEDPEAFTLDEIASICFSLSFAGHETTNYLIGNVMRRLLEDRERWARVVADPAAIPGAVEETLRFDPSVCVWRRVTTRPATVGGVDLPAGAKLFLWLAAAGRDPSVFPDPDAFDVDRDNARRHLAFGRGIHYCLGASLGKLEAELAVAELARRWPELALVDGQELTFHPNISFRGPQALWVRAGA